MIRAVERPTNGHIGVIKNDEPETAFGLAAQISGAKNQYSLLRRIVNTWSKRDPIAAEQAINQAQGLSIQMKQRLRVAVYR